MKIRTRYAVYSLIASAIPLGLVVIVLLAFSKRELDRIEARQVESSMRQVENQIAAIEQDVLSKLRIASQDIEWTRLLLKKDSDGEINQLALIEKATEYRDILGLRYVDIIGGDTLSRLLARSGDYANFGVKVHRPGLGAEVSDTGVVGIWFMNVGTEHVPCLLSSVPLKHGGDRIAFIQGGINIDEHYITKLADIVGGDAAFAFEGQRWITSGESDLTQDEIFDGHLRTITIYPKSFISDAEVALHIVFPESDARRLLERSLWLYSLVALAGVLLSGAIGYLSARRLTVPLNELVDAAEKISEGRFERRIIWFAKDELGKLVDGFNTMFDRLKRSQEKLVQSEKVAAWNQMARKVAHEIRNPLTPIRICVEDLKRSYDAKEPEFADILDGAVETISSEISRLNRMTTEFSQFAKLPSPELKPTDIRRTIGDALRIYTDKIRENKLRVRFPQEEIIIDIDPDLISQVFVNLVKNGFEASGDDGIVEVGLVKGKRIAKIHVEDNGPGVPDDAVDKLFTPHFTTKREGSGLGLVIAYRIVFDHGGRIRYEKRKPNGARFVVVLPLSGRKGVASDEEKDSDS